MGPLTWTNRLTDADRCRPGTLPSAWLRDLEKPGSILCDTARVDEQNYRSLLFCNPEAVLIAQEQEDAVAVLAQVERHLAAGRWVAGYMAYEAGQGFEPSVPRRSRHDMPLAWFCVYRAPRLFDHRNTRVWNEPSDGSVEIAGCRFNLAREEYCRRVEQIRSWIAEGDVYQVNFTGRIGFAFSGSAVDLYLRLRPAQRVSYSAFLNTGDMHVLSFSPELFFRMEQQRIVTRPMKGTAPRGRWLQEDDGQAAWLAADEKNRAENVMIVDLLRNDLGRICEYGSVRVEQLYAVERYDTVLQMTSSVSGKLRQGVGPQRIFRALFPSGSVTGAPKIRAMQRIHELEPAPRGVYCGAIGFFSPDAEAVFNVPIRTLVLRGNHGEMGVGSGIVHDSDPEVEFRECELKAKFLTEHRSEFALIESMLCDRGFPLLSLHLERLQQSGGYFGFALDLDRVQAELYAHAAHLEAGKQYKVRAVIDCFGGVKLNSVTIEADQRAARVAVADERVWSRDPFLFHKTTRRAQYERILARSHERGLDDVLFLKERGEVTEGTMHNVFVKIAGKLLTPPLQCGLLPGVYRKHLLRSDPRCRESVLTLGELQRADGIYICNAVRGMRRAVLLP